MRLRVTDPAATPDLVEFLLERVDCIARQVDVDEVETSLLGSLRQPYARLELEARLREWRLRHPDVEVAVEEP